jgi:hypothetical protein
MNKLKSHLPVTLLAVMLCMTAFSSVAYADGDPQQLPSSTPVVTPISTPTALPIPFTPDGTGTVLNYAADTDGKEFYTIITLDEHVFYLVIDRQRNTENVYFLDAVSVKDLLSLAEDTEDSEPVVAVPTPVPTPETTPQQVNEPEPKHESNAGSIIAVILIIAVIAVCVYCYIKFRKAKQTVKGSSDLDDYNFGDDEDAEREEKFIRSDLDRAGSISELEDDK